MRNKNFLILIIILFSMSFANQVQAIDIIPAQPDTIVEIVEIDSLLPQFIPFTQLAFGFSQRIDHSQLINHNPMILAKLYIHITDKTAAKLGVGISSSNQFKSSQYDTIKYKDFKAELGFRWNIVREIVTIYHENGIEYNYYSESKFDVWEQRVGINLSMGLHFRVYENFIFDISVLKTFNNGSFSATKNINPNISPIGIDDDTFFNEVFNPLAIQVLMFKSL